MPQPSGRTYFASARPPHSTGDELGFLMNLGTWVQPHARAAYTRAELLTRYLEAARIRARWDGIDREQVVAYAHDLLIDLQRKAG